MNKITTFEVSDTKISPKFKNIVTGSGSSFVMALEQCFAKMIRDHNVDILEINRIEKEILANFRFSARSYIVYLSWE